jgi:magnesium-transporting ATPase (P-type)
LEDYGRIGLRTLVRGEKIIEKEYFMEWRKRYQEAITCIDDREAKMGILQEELEKDLNLVGATAIEDKLQDEVEETIRSLRDAGIKVWVLTGDKIETAINIGFSCGLLENDMVKFIVEETKIENVESKFDEILQEVQTVKFFFTIII